MGVRTTQEAIETIQVVTGSTVRTTQYAVELLVTANPVARLTQVAVEAIVVPVPTARATQVVIEVIKSARIPAEYPITIEQSVAVEQGITARTGEVSVTVEHSVGVAPEPDFFQLAPRAFTGVLGLEISQLGIFLLGEPRSPVEAHPSVESSISVDQDIVAEVESNPLNLTIAHSIGVQAEITSAVDANRTISDTITVEQTVRSNRDFTIALSSNIAVTQTITERNTVTRITVSSPVAVAETLTTRGPVSKTVTHSVGVDQNIIVRGREVSITVNQGVGVAQNITPRNSVVRISVIQSISATDIEGEGNTVNRQTITQNVALSLTPLGRNDRLTVAQSVLVTSTIGARNTNVRRSVSSAVAVTQLITAMNPRITLAQSIGVGQTITGRSNNNRQTVSHAIAVGEYIVPAKSPLEMTVEDIVNIPQSLLDHWPARGSSSNPRTKIVDTITISTAIFGGSDNREITVSHSIALTERIDTSWKYQTIAHSLGVRDAIHAGNDNRQITVTDSVLVEDTTVGRPDNVNIIVSDTLIVATTRTARGPIVEETVGHSIHVKPTITPRPVRIMKVTSVVQINQSTRIQENHQIVKQSIGVGQFMRSTPINLTVTQNVNISERSKDIYMIMRDVISVGSKHWNQQDVTLTDTLPIAETLDRQVNRSRELIDELPIDQTLNRFMVWTQLLSDHLILPESSFSRQYSFSPYPIDVPVFHGGLMANLVVLECGNDAITLPAALLGDTKANVDKIIVQRSMNAKTMTIISSSDRQKLTLKFRIPLKKSYELRTFVMANQSKMIRLTDWNGAIWMGRLLSNPFQHTHAGRSATEQEFVTFDIEFEGAKIAG